MGMGGGGLGLSLCTTPYPPALLYITIHRGSEVAKVCFWNLGYGMLESSYMYMYIDTTLSVRGSTSVLYNYDYRLNNYYTPTTYYMPTPPFSANVVLNYM